MSDQRRSMKDLSDPLPATLPMPCPRCGRYRLLPTILPDPPRVAAVACEACETAWPGGNPLTGGTGVSDYVDAMCILAYLWFLTIACGLIFLAAVGVEAVFDFNKG